MKPAYALAKKILFQLSPENAHNLMMANIDWITQLGLHSLVTRKFAEDPIEVMGLRFPNTVGLAAGFDKNGEHVSALGALGFGSIEVGTITPKGQPGNEKPRCFRLPEDGAIINRMGFNNNGAVEALRNLQSARAFRNRGGILGVNIGKNKVTPNELALEDYKRCMDWLYDAGDYLAINISSPNTPNLRDLQATAELKRLLSGIADKRRELQEKKEGKYVPIAVKLAPDLLNDDIKSALDVIVETGMDGVICTNTTISRDLISGHPLERQAGGLSGRPLMGRSTEVTRLAAEHLKGKLPIIASGGIMSGADAVEKCEAGASIVQLYSGFIFEGPELIADCVEAIAQWRKGKK